MKQAHLLEKRLNELDALLTKAGYVSDGVLRAFNDFKNKEEREQYEKWYRFQKQLNELHEIVIEAEPKLKQ